MRELLRGGSHRDARPVITILEGTDATGKTTHARWIHDVQAGGSYLLHYGKPNGDRFDEYIVRPAKLSGNIVMDRSFVGSTVWAGLGFHPPTLTDSQWEGVCLWYATHHAHVIFVVRPVTEIGEVMERRGESAKEFLLSVMGQRDFLRLAMSNRVLYMPVAVYTSNLLRSIRKGTTT